MQAPSGYQLIEGKYIVDSWWAVVFNPTFIPRFIHMLFASYVTTCFVLMAVSGFYLLKAKSLAIAKKCLSFSLWASLILVPVQIIVGDVVGINVHHYQPLKTAAMEGIWQTQKGAPLLLFAIPWQTEQKNFYEIGIPKLASLINTHEWNGEMLGLDSVGIAEQPRMMPVFFSFRIMVGIGIIMLFTAIIGVILRLKGRLFKNSSFHRWCLVMAPLGFVASIAGWLTAELGRQPWVVYNLLKTKDAVSSVGYEEVLISFTLLVLAYGIIFGFYLYYLLKLISHGPGILAEDDIEQHAFQYMTDLPEEKK
jgi:cytochrome d ubiquinol oxidase subunit I